LGGVRDYGLLIKRWAIVQPEWVNIGFNNFFEIIWSTLRGLSGSRILTNSGFSVSFNLQPCDVGTWQ
jgi:hypothetical protein